MKRPFVLLTIVGALLALAVPASSMAATAMTPNNTAFWIEGSSTSSPPTIKTAYGSCSIGQIRSQTPISGEKNAFMPATFVFNQCSSGASISISGKWTLRPYSTTSMAIGAEERGLTMRFASLPGCKLTNRNSASSPFLFLKWTNNQSYSLPSTVSADPSYKPVLAWENDSTGTCSKAPTGPTRETLATFESPGTPGYSSVKSFGLGAPVRTVEVSN